MKIGLIAGTLCMAFQFSAAGAKQLELSCPAELEPFCGGWTVTDAKFEVSEESAEDHVKVNHRFVIGRRGSQIWLYPRSDPNNPEEGLSHLERWGNSVRLVHVLDDNQSCLVGDVPVTRGHPNPELHRIIITSSIVQVDPAIGHERRLVLEMFDSPAGQPLAQVESCENPDESTGKRHEGVVHVED